MLLLNIYALTTPPPFSYNLEETCPNDNMVPIVEGRVLWPEASFSGIFTANHAKLIQVFEISSASKK